MAHRQFIQKESMDVVLCEWDARKGTWRCTSTPGSPYNRRVESLSTLVRGMKAEGFEEVTPSMQRPGRFSKTDNTYLPIQVRDSGAPEVVLSLPKAKKPPRRELET